MGVNADLLEVMGPELELLLPELDEKARRLVLGAVARAAGDGGIGAVAKLSGASWQTVANGAAELGSGEVAPPGRVRRPGAGRPRLSAADPGLAPALLALVEESSRGDPQSPLLWTTKSVRHLSDALTAAGHRCSPQTAWRLLREQGFSTQANAKVTEGRRHPDRDAQFRYIAGQAGEHLAAGQPVISVDAKKKENVGEFAQAGAEWRPRGSPVRVRSHDFPDEGGHAVPYGVYDVGANTGFVNVGTDGNTAALAVESVRRWWALTGHDAYPRAARLLITCDAGGSNGWRNRAWKAGLADLARETGLEITVCHFPPGTSKWNKIEHRLFSQITLAWRGRPLTSHDVVVNTIAAVTTSTGLTVTAALDAGAYPTGTRISDARMTDLEDRALTRHPFHGDWNYALLPAPRPAPPGPPRPPAGPDPAVLHDLAALAGLTARDLDDLAASITTAWHAQLEASLYTARGGPRRTASGGGRNRKLTLPGHILFTILHHRHGASCHALSALAGLDDHAIRLAISRTRDLLAARHPHLLAPATADGRPAPALRQYAAHAGLTLRRPRNRRNPHDTDTKTSATP